ncbi:putative C-type lectin domain family 20 member A [Dissostichus eleginoides]|uniref:C-type lectin domain family 20 member A n=1 Tax=Dissostichus eleginoides TaxID=100907 RepID=A0AAD9F857_DISEL|nr:putative C-type lectin domain family 20 member A [Dissostichus eleginoides]
MMNSDRSLLLLPLLLSSAVSGLGSVVQRYYFYVQSHVPWEQAQSYCRSSSTIYHTDLATIYKQSDENLMYMNYYHAWIGLYKNTSDYWAWSNEENTYFDLPWAQYEPDNGARCATVYYSHKRFYGTTCDYYYYFYCHEQHGDHLNYIFIPQSKTWSEAQQYCRSEFNDLATFRNTSDLHSDINEQDFQVWTGLHRDGETWMWSTGLSDFRNWAEDEPGNNGDCVSISSLNKEMATQNCSTRFPFVCLRHNLVLVKENKTWREALDHCRALNSPYNSNIRFELVSVQPEDHDNVMNKVKEGDTEEVWAGLRFLAGHWVWVNGASMVYSHLPPCPPVEQGCGVLSKNGTGRVEITDCTEKRNFLCYSSY